MEHDPEIQGGRNSWTGDDIDDNQSQSNSNCDGSDPATCSNRSSRNPAHPPEHITHHSPSLTASFSDTDFILVSLPPSTHPSASLHGQTACLLRGHAYRHILSTPGFPCAPTFPPPSSSGPAYTIAPSRNGLGLGMYAVRDLEMGEHILTERPLTVTPTTIRMPVFGTTLDAREVRGEERRKAIMAEWEGRFLKHVWGEMQEEGRKAYAGLANCHAEGECGMVLGVVRTNGFEVEGVRDVEDRNSDGEGGEYAGVCRDLCRVNHSCSPSADRLFDIPSFSFQLRATRPIKSGEEISVSYCTVLDPAIERQTYLSSYGFTCTCTACRPPTHASDTRRALLRSSIDAIDDAFDTWLADPLLADDYVIKSSLRWIRVIEEEGLEASDVYRHHLHALVRACVALGDEEGAVRYGRMLGMWCLGQSGTDDMLRKMGDLEYLRGRPDWGMRVWEDHVEG